MSRFLTEHESKRVLGEAGIPVMECQVADSTEDAVRIAVEIGFPVVLKIVSPKIVHKSDARGVILDLGSETEVGQAYEEIVENALKTVDEKDILGVTVQKMAPQGIEMIVGVTHDVQFGPVLMFGLGGVLTEVLEDVSFRVIPIEERDAEDMMQELRGYKVLQGYRGTDPADVASIKDLLLKVSGFVMVHPEIKEMDLNPVFAYPDGVLVADARIIME